MPAYVFFTSSYFRIRIPKKVSKFVTEAFTFQPVPVMTFYLHNRLSNRRITVLIFRVGLLLRLPVGRTTCHGHHIATYQHGTTSYESWQNIPTINIGRLDVRQQSQVVGHRAGSQLFPSQNVQWKMLSIAQIWV